MKRLKFYTGPRLYAFPRLATSYCRGRQKFAVPPMSLIVFSNVRGKIYVLAFTPFSLKIYSSTLFFLIFLEIPGLFMCDHSILRSKQQIHLAVQHVPPTFMQLLSRIIAIQPVQ